MEVIREYYEHDVGCPATAFTEANEMGLRTCLGCAGIFDDAGKGICVTDKRLDAGTCPTCKGHATLPSADGRFKTPCGTCQGTGRL